MSIQFSPNNAVPLANDFATARFALSEDNLAPEWRGRALDIVQTVREKIGALDWDNLDASTDAAYELFPILVAIAGRTDDGKAVFREFDVTAGTVQRYSTGKSYPSETAIAPHLLRVLKPVVEQALNRLEENAAPRERGYSFAIQ